MKISVCMATYNGEMYIKEQVESILKQMSVNDELIVSDDHSVDRTVDILKAFNDSRIKIFLNSGEKGYTRNFENALKYSSGDIIFLSDQDDIWCEEKIEIMVKSLEKYDLVVSDAEIVNSQLKMIYQSHFELHGVRTGFWRNYMQTRYVGACMAFKRGLLQKALPFPKSQRLCAHDYWLTIIGEAYYKVGIEKTALIKYRRHSNNTSSGGMKSKNSFIKKLVVRVYCMWNLLFRFNK